MCWEKINCVHRTYWKHVKAFQKLCQWPNKRDCRKTQKTHIKQRSSAPYRQKDRQRRSKKAQKQTQLHAIKSNTKRSSLKEKYTTTKPCMHIRYHKWFAGVKKEERAENKHWLQCKQRAGPSRGRHALLKSRYSAAKKYVRL